MVHLTRLSPVPKDAGQASTGQTRSHALLWCGEGQCEQVSAGFGVLAGVKGSCQTEMITICLDKLHKISCQRQAFNNLAPALNSGPHLPCLPLLFPASEARHLLSSSH